MNPNWSPSPWEAIAGTEHHGPYVVCSSGLTVCDLYTMSKPGAFSVRNGGDSVPIRFPDAADNAHLIAAAPDLYEALAQMFDRWEPDTAGADRRMWEEARAALAKARGEPS